MKPVYTLKQYVAIIKHEYRNGDKESAKRYHTVYKQNGGLLDYRSIVKGLVTKQEQKKRNTGKIKAQLKKVRKDYFGF